ncbi:MAG: hypothetical protein JO356_14535 [Acidobacteria bacterium]|nr:hypothetical protein [Acidobacteriota bacterium]
MKSPIAAVALAFAVLFAGGCSKPNQTPLTSSNQPDQPAASATEENALPAQESHQAITIPSGKVFTVRLATEVGSKISQPGESFGGSLAKAVEVDGATIIPAGSKVEGEVVDAKPLGRFAGGALLQLRLNSVRVNGEQMPLQAALFTQTLKGKGKRTGTLIGGGAGLGALIGGIAGGGKGALIGAAAGAGAGTAGTAFTGNKEIVLSAESAIPFKLKAPLTIKR